MVSLTSDRVVVHIIISFKTLATGECEKLG